MTTTAYDGLGRPVSETLPGETSGLTTRAWAYDTGACGGAGSGPQTPCVRVDETQRVNASTTVAAHAFYNGYGQVAETRDQAPGGQDVVRYAVYDASSREVRASNPYFVGAWNGSGLGYSLDDANQPGAVFTYDGLGRTLTSADPLGNVTATSHGVTCSVLGSGTGDDSCYIATNVTDANAHRSQVFSDAFGRTTYTRDLRGDGSVGAPYVAYRAVAATYDYAGNETAITQPNGSATSFTYDDAGRQLTMSDPDRGDESYAYDANGNVIQATDARTVSVYAGYDGLNRQIWRNSGDTPSGAYVTYAYDGSPFGNGLGRLTAEVFRGSPGTGASDFSGAYSYRYDARGRLLGTDQTMGGAGACPTGGTGWICQDIGTPGKAGSQSYAGDGVWTVSGGGTDIWGGNDQFRFVSQSLAGDGALSAQVASQTNTNGWAKAGLMMRASGGANNAPFYAVEVTPEQDISVQYRDTAGGVAAVQATTSGAAPIYLKIARSGVTYSAYTSTDGASWTLIPGSSRTMSALSGTVAAGLAVTTHDNTTVSTATFAQVSAPSGTVAPPASIVSYPVSASYDDAGEPLSLTYPDGAVASTSYSQGSLGWLAGVSWTQNSLTTPVLSAVSYSGAAGAFGAITSANVGQAAGAALYHYAAQLDSDGRLVADDLVTVSTGAMLFDEQMSYDPVGNVAAVTTVLPAGTDHQLFCYDEQNRLTWAGTTSGNPCGNPGSTGSFGGASYTQTFGYDTLNRLTSGPPGTYSYSDASHLHAATSVSGGYTASYDAAGDMVCRAPSSATTCVGGAQTGQQLTWDVEGRLTTWQNATICPTLTAQYLSDGEGHRVVQRVTDSTAGTTTTTSYVGHLET